MRLRQLTVLVLCSSVAGSAPAFAQPPRLVLTETVRLDTLTPRGRPVRSAVTGPRGVIAVGLESGFQLRLYDSTGKHLADFGSRGDGPGEFRGSLNHGWVGDTLWVYDSGRRRFTLVSSAGELIRTVALPDALSDGAGRARGVGTNVYSYTPWAYLSNGASIGSAMLNAGRAPDGRPEREQVVVHASPAGAVTRLVAQPPTDPVSASVRLGEGGGIQTGVPVPFLFQPVTTFATDGGRFAFLTTIITSRQGGVYTVSVFTAKGDTVFARRYPFTGEPIPAGVVDSALTHIATTTGTRSRLPGAAAEAKQVAGGLMPSVYPPVGTVLLGRDGTVWVTLRATNEGVVALVLDSKGDVFASVLVPPRSSLLEVSLGRVLVAQRDANDRVSVVRYAVSGANPR